MDRKSKNPKHLYTELKKMYPHNHGMIGYKPSMVSTVLAIITYIVTFGQYSPRVLGSLLYFIPVLLAVTVFLPTISEGDQDTEDQDETDLHSLRISSMYLLFVLLVTFCLYFAYSSFSGFTTTLIQMAGNSTFLVVSAQVVNVLIGIPVTASFYYALYTYYNVLVDAVSVISSEK